MGIHTVSRGIIQDAVLANIQLDVEAHDFTALDELLNFVPLDKLIGYLPDHVVKALSEEN